jgi:hypothetical protein
VITSPDNSFLPGGPRGHAKARLRGVPAVMARGGRTIEIATSGVVVDIHAKDARLAAAAARTLVPINRAGGPDDPLPAPAPDTRFAETPLPSQIPSPVRQLR